MAGSAAPAYSRTEKNNGGNAMAPYSFDESNIPWRTLDWLENLYFYVYNVDEKNRIVDIIFKFPANTQVMLHQHKSNYVTVVLQGELRFYRPNGELKEIRPTGSYVIGKADGEPHTEGGGDQDAIVFFSNRDIDDALYEFLDEDMNPVQVLGFEDFKAALKEQIESGDAAQVAARAA
jgi:hypothetical protein